MLPTQHPVRMALLFSFFFKISLLIYPYMLRSATMLSVQRLHQLFPDEIGCLKFLSVSKATKEKNARCGQI